MLVLGLIDLPLWFIIPSLVVLTFYIYTEYLHTVFRRHGIPGPKPLPFVGGLINLLKLGSPELFLKDTKTYGRLYGYFLGNYPLIIVTDVEVIKEVFVKRFADFPSRSKYLRDKVISAKTLVFAHDYESWKLYKSVTSPAFTSGKLKNMEEVFTICLDEMIVSIKDKASETKPVDMTEMLNYCTIDIACRVILGVEDKFQGGADNPIAKLIKDLVDSSQLKNIGLVAALFLCPAIQYVYNWLDIGVLSNQHEFKNILGPIMEMKKLDKRKRMDLLQIMLDSRLENKTEESKPSNIKRDLTDEEIRFNAVVFMSIASESPATALSMAFYYIATDSVCQERLFSEIDAKIGKASPTFETLQECEYLEMVLSEVFRLNPLLTRISRHSPKEEVINGYNLPKNIDIELPIYALHRLEEYWPNPSKFDPERFSAKNKANIKPFSYIPFGLGPRTCIGERYAKLLMKIVIAKVLQNFRLKIPSMANPPKFIRSLITRLDGGMPLLLQKRDNKQTTDEF